MNAAEKEWLRAEKEWLDRQDERLLRLYGADYVKWLDGETDHGREAKDVRDADDRLPVQLASTPSRDRVDKGPDLPRVDEPAWVLVRCTAGACKRSSCTCTKL